MRVALWLCSGLIFGAGLGQGAAQAAAGRKTCTVEPAPVLSEADKALHEGKFADAAQRYAAMPASAAVTAGLVRARLGERKLDEALALVQKELTAKPNDALLLDLLGEVRYRRGEPGEAAVAYNRSLEVDGCLARTHYDVARYLSLSGMEKSAQKQLDVAHLLAPESAMIREAWERTQQVPMSVAEQVTRLKKRAEDEKLSAEERAELERRIRALESESKGDCVLATPAAAAKIPLYAVNGSNNSQTPPTSSGVDVYLNGKRRRFLVDTGASGLLLSRSAAKSLGLTAEAEVKSSGIGDEGSKGTYLAHVDDLKVGSMEFHNCMVRVLEADTLRWTDGLLGPDMFRSFLVTLDFPAAELRLSALPPRPDEAAKTASLETAGEAGAGAPGQKIAELRRDRYVAPAMQDWTKVFRYGHDLIVPAAIGNAPTKLFILDTGAGQNLISTAAAREVTHVSGDASHEVSGISGKVKKVYDTESMTITFAHVRQPLPYGLTAIDTSGASFGPGVEISGFIGYPTLHQLVMEIDYRDDLVHVTYLPHVGQ